MGYHAFMAIELTPKQDGIFRFIQRYLEDHQGSPSLREIGSHFGIDPGTVRDQINALEKKGYLKRQGSQARGIHIPGVGSQIPILGSVFAGSLHMAFEDVEGYIPAYGLAPGHHFALKVKGDSMVEANIVEGDIAIVRRQPNAHPGDIVVALIEGETTLKYLRQKGSRFFLQPGNPKYPLIESPDLEVLGKVVEVRRRYG
jgi:repressor LexA